MKIQSLFLFCTDSTKDPVSPQVYNMCLESLPLKADGASILGSPVKVYETSRGSRACLAPIPFVASHRWSNLQEDLRRDFGEFDQIVIVNWHQGTKAPERVFCAHTAADVPSGNFAPANPSLLCSLLHAVERSRVKRGLCDWSTLIEASHWSGIPHGGSPSEVTSPGVPIIDFEIGSFPQDWTHPDAVSAMVDAIATFDEVPDSAITSLVFCGGEHFEKGATQPLFRQDGLPVFFSHHLPNQWMVSGNYGDEDGVRKVLAAAASVKGGVQGLVFHDNLKGPIKETVRLAAQKLGVPSFNHKKLRDPIFVESLC
jgi:D-tyrosyl-tRNA(Tyr) deacylase